MRKIIALKSGDGFTIVELMIALSVLSVILVMTTVVLIQIGALYVKGVNAANLQNTSRIIVADVSASLQFSGNAPASCTVNGAGTSCDANPPTGASYTNPQSYTTGSVSVSVHAFCIGTVRYSYVLDSEQGTDNAANSVTGTAAGAVTPHVLWRDIILPNTPCQPLDLSQTTVPNTDGTPSGGYDMASDHMRLTRFKIWPPAGDSSYGIDVWMAYGDSDLVNTSASGQSTCSGGAGTQFCSVSQISSAVRGRAY